MNNNIQLVLKSSTAELPLNDKEYGIYLVPELEGLTGLPEIRTTSGVNSGYDGGWTSAQNYDARSITIRGVIANEDVATVERLRRALTTLAGQGKNEELTLDLVTEAGAAYTLQVHTIALEMAMQKVLKQQEFLLQLRADDPLVYDASETTHEAVIQVAKATGGFPINFEIPLAIDGGSEDTIVNNDGLERAPTITRLYGALHNPKIINHTTNQYMQLNTELGYSEGEWVTPVEAGEGKVVTIDDAPDGALLSKVDIYADTTTQKTANGKNLVPPVKNLYNSGLNFVVQADGSTKVFGTPSSQVVNDTDISNITLPAGTYTLSITLSGTAPAVNSGAIAVRKYIESEPTGETIASLTAWSSGSTTFTLSSATRLAKLRLFFNANNTINCTYYVQLEKSSSATSFAPYIGGTDAPNAYYPISVNSVTGMNKFRVTGKNLVNPSGEASDQFLNNSGGWSTDPNNLQYVNQKIPASGGESFTFSWESADSNAWIRVGEFKADGTFIQRTLLGSTQTPTHQTITTNSECAYIITSMNVGNVAGFVKPMFEKGSTASDYEQYRGEEYDIDFGSNLFNSANPSTLNAYISTSKVISSQAASDRIYWIPCEPNTSYTIHRMMNATPSANRFRVATTATTPTYGAATSDIIMYENGDATTDISITTNSSARYLCFNIFSTLGDTSEAEMLNSITVMNNNRLELCKLGTYQDYIYHNNYGWFVHRETKKYLVQGFNTRDWTGTWYRFTYNKPSNAPERLDTESGLTAYSNMAKLSRRGGTWDVNDSFAFTPDAAFVASNELRNMTVEEANAWLTKHVFIIYYPLDTPEEEQITDQGIIAQLDQLLYMARTYEGENEITLIPAENTVQPTIDVAYFTEQTEGYRDEVVIDSRMRTITLNGLDIYHLKTAGSEFLMLAPGENRLSLQSDITGDNGYAEVSYKQGYLSI